MMKKPVSLSPRTALFIGAALLAIPAFAQDAPQQTVTPPPITAPAPQPPLTPAPAPAPTLTLAPPVLRPAAPVTASTPARARPAATATHAARTVTQTRTTTTTRRATAPAETAAPAPAPAPAPVEQAAPAPIEPQAVTPAPAPAPEQVAPAPAPVRTAGPIWPWLLGGAILVIGALALLLRRRRTEYDSFATEYEPAAEAPMPEPAIAQGVATPLEPETQPLPLVDVEPVPEVVREPLVATAAEEATIAEPDAAELAEVTEGAAPVGHRPWIELGIRPVRAGTSEEEALVEIELTVGNAGDMEAKDVRISTFMLAEGESSEMEQLLTEHAGETAVPPVTIGAGEGTRVDATLAVPKGDLGRTFNPLVVADARYRLPDGSEGRTSASFRVGRPAGEGGLGPIGSSRPHIVDDVAAELDQLLERA